MEVPANTREYILFQALRLFAKKGYEAIGVASICEAAGITKPTMYYHFGSKRGLLEALISHWGTELLTGLDGFLPTSSDQLSGDAVKAYLDQITSYIWDYATINPDFYRLILAQYHAPPQSEGSAVVLPFLTELQGRLNQLFNLASPWHGAFRGREAIYAHTFLGMVHSWVGLSLSGGCNLDAPNRREAIHHYLHGIFS